MIRKLIFISTLAALLAGCGAMESHRLGLLDQAIIRYSQALRWQRYEDAQAYHMTREGERRKIDQEALKHIRISGYQIQEKNMGDDLMEAEVVGVMEYFNDSRGTIRKVPMTQTWWFDPESKRWFVTGELPQFK